MDVLIAVVYIILRIIWILCLMAGYREVNAMKSRLFNIAYLLACITYLVSTSGNTFNVIVANPSKVIALVALITLALLSLALNKFHRNKYEVYEDAPTVLIKKIATIIKGFKDPVSLVKDKKEE